VPPADTTTPRSIPARRTKPVLVGELATGAILGALIWLAVRSLGLHSALHLSPANGIAPAALLGALVGASRYRVLLWLASTALVALFAVVAFTPMIVRPVQALIRSDPIPSPPLTIDAIVVLGGGVTTDGLLPPDAVDRMLSGLRLARATGTTAFVITRARNSRDPRITSDADQKSLIDLTSTELRVFTVSDVLNTRDEAIGVRDLAAKEGWARIAVVTSPAHTRRACGTFEKVGLRVTCVPAESRRVPVRSLTTPGDRIAAFELWIYEIAGTIKHRVRGWLP